MTDVNILIVVPEDITEEEFKQLHEAIKLNTLPTPTFHIEGSNIWAQEYLGKEKLIVYDLKDQNSVLEDNITHRNGYETYQEMKKAMMNNTNAMIIFLRNIASSLSSDAFHILLAKKYSLIADAFQKHAKGYDDIYQCINNFSIEHQVMLRELVDKVLVM